MKKQKTPRPKSQILDRLTLSRCIKCNLRMMIYWLAAATLTACVTYTGGAK